MIREDVDLGTKEEGMELTEGLNDGEEFLLYGGVIALILLELAAVVSNRLSVLLDHRA